MRFLFLLLTIYVSKEDNFDLCIIDRRVKMFGSPSEQLALCLTDVWFTL